jgi:hypothetical protein
MLKPFQTMGVSRRHRNPSMGAEAVNRAHAHAASDEQEFAQPSEVFQPPDWEVVRWQDCFPWVRSFVT